MAMVALQLALEKLVTLLTNEAALIGGVREGVCELQDDLESMRSFMQDAEARSETDQGVRTWVKQVKDVANETDDVLEDFLLHLSSPEGHGFLHSLLQGFRSLQQLRKRHLLAVRIQNVKRKVKAISERRSAFSFRMIEESATTVQTWHDPRLASHFLDESDVVGIENPKSVLIPWLVRGEENLSTISVVGMGGVGKTTLVKKVYDSQPVKEHFYCHAWVTVSKSFSAAELLRAALKDFLEERKEQVPEGIDTMTDIQLVQRLRDHLQDKRYVIVFDDVWSINAWEVVKFALPDNCYGSRIILTTRLGEVATSVETICHVYNLQPLPDEEAWTLFCRKAFRGESEGVCPQELVGMSQSILKKCGGLPLAITIIGGLLSKKDKSVLEWKKIYDRLAAELKRNSSFQSLERILLLSYYDLPHHLKCCFLYLSVFPEDYLIKRMKIIRLWVVERFVEKSTGRTMEEIAEDYLNELVSRNMIQVVKIDHSNRVLSCRVHDVMREIIQSKAKDEWFVTVVNDRITPLEKKSRRMSIHDGCKDLPSDMNFPNLRSLLVFGISVDFQKGFFEGFRLITLLELEGAELREFPPEIIGMIHLRYLSLRRTMIRNLPESIRKLKNLEILDLKYSGISSLPAGILKLKYLSQLRAYTYGLGSYSQFPSTYGMSLPKGIGALTNLQKLANVDVNGNSDMVRELGMLTQLRRLGILKLTQEDGMALCCTLEKLKHLTALYMVSISPSEPLDLDSLASTPQLLQRLYLKSRLPALPKWITSLQHLAKLVLQHSNLRDDPLKSLQELPNLVELELREAYAGEELCCNVGGYRRLRKLSLVQLVHLKQVRVEQGAMAGLRELQIALCDNLEMVPTGIEHLRNVEYLMVWCMPNDFCQKLEVPDGEDLWKVQHITKVQYF